MTKVSRDEVLKFSADAALDAAVSDLKKAADDIDYVLKSIGYIKAENGMRTVDVGTLANTLTSIGNAIRKASEGNVLLGELSDDERKS